MRPFDAGLAPLDFRVRTHITNLYGTHIAELVRTRLSRTYALSDMYVHYDSDASATIEAAAALDAPPSMSGLREIVARLRRPDGCPWDREQTSASMIGDFMEEVAEVCAAIEGRDWENLAEELGDVLLHVCMQSQIAAESDRFAFEDVVSGIASKLIRRHPHVFGGESATTADDVLAVWRRVKLEEKATRETGQS
jgi:tetrapyrrole methylase family protein / MazG family protein